MKKIKDLFGFNSNKPKQTKSERRKDYNPENLNNFFGLFRSNLMEEGLVKPSLSYNQTSQLGKIGNYRDLPEYVKIDVFKSLYYEFPNYKITDRYIQWWHMLSVMDLYNIRTLTVNKFWNSKIATRHILMGLNIYNTHLIDQKKRLCGYNSNGSNIIKKIIQEGSEKDKQDQQNKEHNEEKPSFKTIDMFDDVMITDEISDNDLKSISDETKQKIEDEFNLSTLESKVNEGVFNAINDILNKDRLTNNWFGCGYNDLKEMDPSINVTSLINKLQNIQVDKRTLNKMIDKIIKGSKNSTGFGKEKIVLNNLIDAENFSDIINPELIIFPEFIDDVICNDIKKFFKIDVYLDTSGSMGNELWIKGQRIRRADLGKMIAHRLYEKRILNNIHRFSFGVHNVKNIMELWLAKISGGTSIENCIKHIEKENNPSIIITDGQAPVIQYDKNAFIILLTEDIKTHSERLSQQMINENHVYVYTKNHEIVNIKHEL